MKEGDEHVFYWENTVLQIECDSSVVILFHAIRSRYVIT